MGGIFSHSIQDAKAGVKEVVLLQQLAQIKQMKKQRDTQCAFKIAQTRDIVHWSGAPCENLHITRTTLTLNYTRCRQEIKGRSLFRGLLRDIDRRQPRRQGTDRGRLAHLPVPYGGLSLCAWV